MPPELAEILTLSDAERAELAFPEAVPRLAFELARRIARQSPQLALAYLAELVPDARHALATLLGHWPRICWTVS